MNRSNQIRARLEWSQAALGTFLGLDQSTVSCLCAGRRETGPVSRLLDQLQRAIDSGLVAVGMTPEDAARAVLSAIEKDNAA